MEHNNHKANNNENSKKKDEQLKNDAREVILGSRDQKALYRAVQQDGFPAGIVPSDVPTNWRDEVQVQLQVQVQRESLIIKWAGSDSNSLILNSKFV